MASPQDIEKLKRNISETWEESFQGVKKNSDEFYKLVEEFTNFVGDWKEFSDVRRDRLAQYILDLDNVEDHWEDINDWVQENSDTLDHYVGSLSDLQSVFKSISSEVGGIQRQSIDRLNVVRQLSRLATDSLAATQQEGGLSRNIISSLDKRKAKVQELYNSELKQLGVLNTNGVVDESRAEAVFRVNEARARALQEQVDALTAARARGIKVDNGQIRNLENQIRYHKTIAEFTEKNNRLAVTGLVQQLDRQKELWKIQREGLESKAGINAVGADKVSAVSGILKKFGLGESAKELDIDYGNFITKRVVAQQNVDAAKDKNRLGQQALDAAKSDWESLQSYLPESIADLQDQLNRKILEKEAALSELSVNKSLASRVTTNSAGQPIDSRTGQYVSEDLVKESEEAAAKVRPLEKEVRDLEKEIKGLSSLLSQDTEKLESSKLEYEAAKKYAVSTANEEKDAIDAQNVVLQDKFNLTEKIVENFKKGYLQLGKWGGPLGAALALALAIYHRLLKFDEEAVKTKRVIGQWADASALANTKFVTGTEVLKTMRDLGEQFHINPVQVFSSQELGRIAEAQKLTGMSAQAAGNLGVQSKIIGKNADSYRDSIAAGANQANKLNHSAVNLSAVQNDVLNTSRAITMSYGQNVEGLARAASTAASLGMNLQDVENISRNLINFQSSIEAEMQAQLLTGQQLNLARARELALNNDLEGVAREISSQGVDAAKFSHMNLIQQENMAKALGMSREQMSKMLIMQEINKGLTAQQVAAMTGMRKEDIEALSAQEKWQTMKQRFLETLVPLLEPVLQVVSDIFRLLTPVVGAISWILGKVSTLGGLIKEDHVYLRALVGTLAVGIPVALLKGISLVGVLGKAFKGLAKVGVSVGKSIAGWATNLAAAGKNAQATGGILGSVLPQRDYQGRTARQRLRDIRKLEATKSVNPAGAAATSRASASMGSTISKIGKNIGKIALGAAAAVLIAGAVFILAKAAQEFMKVSWGAMAKAGVALLGLVGIVAAVGAIMSSQIGTVLILAGAAAMVVMAGAVALLGVALKTLDGINWEGFKGIGKAMWSLASAGIAAMVAGPALMVGAIKLIPGAYALAQAFKVLATAENVNTANILQTIKDLKSIEIPEVSNFQRLQKIAQVLVRTSRRLRNASFRPLENLSNLGTGLSSTANALVRVGEAIGLIATNLNQLDSEKLSSLRSSRLSGSLARIRSRLQERVENLKENTGSQKETIAAANQEVTVKKANQNTATQQISIEQRATDLKVIERKLDNVIAAIGNSRPDWDWVKFEQARTRNLSWVK